jgi:serine/threonine-protein kinase HipA
MQIATPQITTGRAGGRTYLLAQRYDRTLAADRWRRLHQEDFCQALGKLPSAKYETNHSGLAGPTLADMFALARAHLAAIDLLRLLDTVELNVLVCNTDAHAKNYAVMIKGNGACLAPVYDVMCAEVWEHVTENLAQGIGGARRGDTLRAAHWRQLARDCGLNPGQVRERVRALAQAALSEAESAAAEVGAMPAGSHPVLQAARAAVERRARRILAQLAERSAPGEGEAAHAAAPAPAA